ncbi:PQQ-binding-like beta-propeller repeat protein [Halorubrum sp. AJ67]|uniref:outer membrane protein assembly factor BamB family protein n=1 Tax=Halorubrum sp. AJ67 TaxID=1173487 RepID=UPI0003DD76DB|nr:PQQ-binding-like beta-propeller repeat protein [Halorubrum sp. AJ67]CDK38216.1 putative signal peptide protein [Halorubrum sp. AJ67]
MRRRTSLTRRKMICTMGTVGAAGAFAGCVGRDSQSAGSLVDDSTTQWPTFRRNRFNTGYVDRLINIQRESDWTFETEGDIWGSPVADSERVYCPSYDGYIYAIDAQSGDLDWKVDTGAIIDGSPGVGENIVCCGTHGGEFLGLNKSNGEVEWRYTIGGIIRGSPAIVDGTVYLGTHCQKLACEYNHSDEDWPEIGEVVALDLEMGEKLWGYETGAGVVSTPSVSESTVYIGSTNKNVIAIDRDTGDKVWEYAANDWVWASPVLVNGSLYIADMSGTVFKVDAATGETIWEKDTASRYFTSSPAVDADTVYIGAVGPSGVIALARSDGRKKWRATTGAVESGSSPLISQDKIIVGKHTQDDSTPGGLSAISKEGEVLWEIESEGLGVGSSPIVANDSLLYATVGGKIASHAID